MTEGQVWGKATDALAHRIAAEHEDPATWKLALRREAVRLGLDPIRIDFGGPLRHAAFSMGEEARRQGKRPEDLSQ